MKLLTVAILAVLVSTAGAQVSQEITVDELRTHLEYLASDELVGRKPGTEGGRAASAYIHEQMKALNLEFPADNGYQYFDVVTSITAGPGSTLAFGEKTWKTGEDFTPVAISGNASLDANVVFVGFGFDFDADSLAWHDYEGVDVTGAWVMILRGSPDDENADFDPYSSIRKKTLVAKDHGAAGVLFVSGPRFDKADELSAAKFEKQALSMGVPALHIMRPVADEILAGSEKTVRKLEKALVKSGKGAPFSLEVSVSGSGELVRNTVKTANVVAILRGSDPVLKNEYIVLGAHYDHLGMGGPGSGSRTPDTLAVHNGADDNASGTAAIIEIMENLASRRGELKRSVLFMAFGAEEMGLLGSKHFMNNPLVPLKDITVMINLDMVGRLNTEDNALTIGGTGTAEGMDEFIKQIAEENDQPVKTSPEGYGPSDHASFYSRDVPVLFLFTGVHEDYHTPVDDVDRLNIEGEKNVCDLAADIVFRIANRDDKLVYQEAGPKEVKSGRRRFKVTLGIMPDVASSDGKGLRADGVMKGRPASMAGMKKGDVIVAIEGKPVTTIYDYMDRLTDLKVGQRITVDVLRDEKRLTLIVQL